MEFTNYYDEEDEDAYFDEESGMEPATVIACTVCQSLASVRACQVVLLADTEKNLFSSDAVLPCVHVDSNNSRPISTCECQICDMNCVFCKIPLGYKVVEPCESCLADENNGHYFMFSSPHLTKLFERDIDDNLLRARARIMETEPDQLFLWYIHDSQGQFNDAVENDFFHRTESQRQRDIIDDLAVKRTAARKAVQRLVEMTQENTQITVSVEHFVYLLNQIAMCPERGQKSVILSCCRQIKASVPITTAAATTAAATTAAATTATATTPTRAPSTTADDIQHKKGHVIVQQWTKEIAVSLGYVLKAYNSLRHVGNNNALEEEDEDNDEVDVEQLLFWTK